MKEYTLEQRREYARNLPAKELMTLAEHEELSKNPDYQQVPAAPGLHSGRGLGGGLKIDDGFNDVLKEIKKKHSGGYKLGRSTIHTK